MCGMFLEGGFELGSGGRRLGFRVNGESGADKPALPVSLPQGRLLGHSPVLRNVTNSQAPGSWRKREACSHAETMHSPREDKENVRF